MKSYSRHRNTPAYPVVYPEDWIYTSDGITTRQYFTAAVLQGLSSCSSITLMKDKEELALLAERAVQLADAAIDHEFSTRDEKNECTWELEEATLFFRTKCGRVWFEPHEFHKGQADINFCLSCGKPVKVVNYD